LAVTSSLVRDGPLFWSHNDSGIGTDRLQHGKRLWVVGVDYRLIGRAPNVPVAHAWRAAGRCSSFPVTRITEAVVGRT
jgi:hypothetical protein